MLNPLMFREYDIRGVVGIDLDEDVARTIGLAFGTWLRLRGLKSTVIGRDARNSSPGFATALISGLLDTGIDVLDIGMVPTPLTYFAMFTMGVDSAAMITGSHNPKDFNGFKLNASRKPIYGETLQEIRKIAEAGVYEKGKGELSVADPIPAYLDRIVQDARFPAGSRRLKVVVDAGNGVGGLTALELFRRLGIDVTPLYCEPDGDFPNHHPDPTVIENLDDLRAEVAATGAHLGIGFDGDADRLGVVTENGDVVFGDMLLLILARAVLHEQPGATIVSEVKCSQVLFDQIEKAGGHSLMWKAGHSLIKAKMAEVNSALGGEMSGHLFFAHRWYGFDDAVYAAVRLLEIVAGHDGPFSSLLADVPTTHSTPEIRVDCPDAIKFDVVAKVADSFKNEGADVVAVDGVRVRMGNGWGLVRASNTQPVLVLRFEADSPANLTAIRDRVNSAVSAARSQLE